MIVDRIVDGLTGNEVETGPEHDDPALRGRTYGIPFDMVWRAALRVAEGRRRWTITRRDDLEGRIVIEATTLVFKFVDDMEVNISLDENAQTRVDARSSSRKGKADLGTNARRLRRFFRDLDREVARVPTRKASRR
ncbi:MAG: DUF1499 domain-containing protein [Longimicrobiales bacterium]